MELLLVGNCYDETVNAGSYVDTSKMAVNDSASIFPNPAESVPIMDETDVCDCTGTTCSDSCVKDCTYQTLEWVSQLPDDSSDRADPVLSSEVSYSVNGADEPDAV